MDFATYLRVLGAIARKARPPARRAVIDVLSFLA